MLRMNAHVLLSCLFVFVLSVCLGQELENGPPGYCPQEMCFFVFDRLEEQTQRLRNVEEVLKRAVSWLSSDERLTGLSEALKSDPVIQSLFNEESTVPSSPDWFVALPVSLRDDGNANGRYKRHTVESGLSHARKRLQDALNWAKKNSHSSSESSNNGFRKTPTLSVSETPVNSSLWNPPVFKRKEVNITSDRKTTSDGKIFKNRTVRALQEPNIDVIPVSNINATISKLPLKSKKILDPSASPENTTKNILMDITMTTWKKYTEGLINNLEDAIKCSTNQRNYANISEKIGSLNEPQAIFNASNSLTINFKLKTCQEQLTFVWIHPFRFDQPGCSLYQNSGKETCSREYYYPILQIPRECWTEKDDVYSFTTPSILKSCSFPLIIPLTECHVYSFEITPIYHIFQGRSVIAVATIPPKIPGNSTSLSLIGATYEDTADSKYEFEDTRELKVEWSVQSDMCAHLLTTVELSIYKRDADATKGAVISSYSLPDICISKHNDGSDNRFTTLVNPTSYKYHNYGKVCPLLEPLPLCRYFFLELQPKYLSTLKGQSSFIELFTTGKDEVNCCYLLTSPTGSFNSHSFSDESKSPVCSWLVSVEQDHTIWLTFTKLNIKGYKYHIKVFDGPYKSNRLLVDYSGNKVVKSVISSTNQMLVQLQHQHEEMDYHNQLFTAHYIAVKGFSSHAYDSGCGGYLRYHHGYSYDKYEYRYVESISKPAFPTQNISECFWFIENGSDYALALMNSEGIFNFPMIVYDGWSEDGFIIYDQSSSPKRTVVYSFSNKFLIKFPAWNSDRGRSYYYTIDGNIQYRETTLTEDTGTITSPNYPSVYGAQFYDYSWNITVNATSKIQLTFGYFDTEENYDFVSVYDGPTYFAPLIFEKSGKMLATPIYVNSTSDRMVVRFTTARPNSSSRSDHKGLGFLAMYSAVVCDKTY